MNSSPTSGNCAPSTRGTRTGRATPRPAAVVRTDQALVVEDGRVVWIGARADAPAADVRTSVGGRTVLPGWVDSHTHLVFAGDRSTEFVDRMAGRAVRRGRIMTTVRATRAASTPDLLARARSIVDGAVAQGTTTIEAKTGYGLAVAAEERLARIAAEVADVVTFLGAHVVPDGVDRAAYLDQVTGPMLAAVAPYAQFVDVFCEDGAFTSEESRRVLLAGRRAGLGLRVHGNQLGESGGVALAWSSAPRASTTATTCRTPTSTPSRGRRPSPRCCPRATFPPERRSPRLAVSSTRASGSPWRRTATRGPRSRPRCSSRSPRPCCSSTSRSMRPSARPPSAEPLPSDATAATTPSAACGSADRPTCRCSTPPPPRTSPTARGCP